MTGQLYLQPPTLGEFLFALKIRELSAMQALAELRDLLTNKRFSSVIRKEFTVPKKFILEGEVLSASLENLGIITDYRPNIADHEDPTQVMEGVYKSLRPEETLERGGGDCKSYAIFMVAALRRSGNLSRFYCPSNHHVSIEVRTDDQWIRRNPLNYQALQIVANRGSEHERAYERALRLFTEEL